MMFSVSDILGLNTFMRQVLTNAAGAICGMAQAQQTGPTASSDKPLIGMTNLGVLTKGTELAVEYLESQGFEVLVFHAVGAGGRAMEQMMRDGLIQGVLDYALGEISDELFHGLRAGGKERLTTAGKLGLPQVLVPGGAEHVGIFLDEPNVMPETYADHQVVFHSPVIAAPRLSVEQLTQLAAEIGDRLAHSKDKTVFMLPGRGTSRYAISGGPLHNPESDRQWFAALKAKLPKSVELVERDLEAEDEAFVREACDRLVAMLRPIA
jgi:uncharacterized protein (UPF0261 family)